MPAPTSKAKSTTPAADTEAPAAPVAPTIQTLDDVCQQLRQNRAHGIEAALAVYRAAATKLADDKPLDSADLDPLAHALSVLELQPETLRSDIDGIKKHRAQLQFSADAQKITDELSQQAPTWSAELEKLQARKLEIAGLQARLQTCGVMAGQHLQEANRLVVAHRRVLGDIAEAVAETTKRLSPPDPPTNVAQVWWN